MKKIILNDKTIPIIEGGFFDTYKTKVDLKDVESIEKQLNKDCSFFKSHEKKLQSFGNMDLWVPINYYDASAIQGIFTANAKELKKLLPKELNPICILPNVGLLAITSFNYRSSDADPYNEFSVMIVTEKPNSRSFGPFTIMMNQMKREAYGYVWKLPVDTALAEFLGKESYSFPKYITDITFETEKKIVSSSVMNNGKPEITLIGRKIKTKKNKLINANILLNHNNKIANVVSQVNPIQAGISYRNSSCKIELGEGPIADKLRTLRIGRSIRYDYMPDIQIKLKPKNF